MMMVGEGKHAWEMKSIVGLRRFVSCLFLIAISTVQTAEAQVSDLSDSLWSIVRPAAVSFDVDMGIVFVGDTRDSLVSGFIRNSGPTVIRIDSISFSGGDADMFELVSGLPPFELDTGEAHTVEFRFIPASVGVKSATIDIRTQASSFTQSISGVGVLPIMAVSQQLLDFGSLNLGEMKDTLASAVIRNIGPDTIHISGCTLLGPDQEQFSVISGGGTFVLGPGESKNMILRFAPTRRGRTSGSIGLYHDGPSSPAVLRLFGSGITPEGSATIAVDTIRANIGDLVEIPLYLRNQHNLEYNSGANFYTELRFDASILSPTGDTPKGRVENGERTIQLDAIPVPIDGQGRLTTLRFIAMLGAAEGTPLTLGASFAAGGNIAVTKTSGYFLLNDICRDGGVRLFSASGKAGLQQNRPNPFNATTLIEYEVIEQGLTKLFVMDVLGRVLAVLLDADVEAGRYTISFDASRHASGTYVLVLQTPTQRFIKLMEVVK